MEHCTYFSLARSDNCTKQFHVKNQEGLQAELLARQLEFMENSEQGAQSTVAVCKMQTALRKELEKDTSHCKNCACSDRVLISFLLEPLVVQLWWQSCG